MPKMPPLPNSDATASVMRLLEQNPGLTIADIEFDPLKREYRLRETADERISVGNDSGPGPQQE